MRTEFYVFLYRVTSGPRVKLAGRKSALNPPVVAWWKSELISVLFVCFIDLCLFGFVGFLFLLVSGKGCGL